MVPTRSTSTSIDPRQLDEPTLHKSVIATASIVPSQKNITSSSKTSKRKHPLKENVQTEPKALAHELLGKPERILEPELPVPSKAPPGVDTTSPMRKAGAHLETIIEQDSYSTFNERKSDTALHHRFGRLQHSLRRSSSDHSRTSRPGSRSQFTKRHVSAPVRTPQSFINDELLCLDYRMTQSCEDIGLYKEWETTMQQEPAPVAITAKKEALDPPTGKYKTSAFQEDLECESGIATPLTLQDVTKRQPSSNISKIIKKLFGSCESSESEAEEDVSNCKKQPVMPFATSSGAAQEIMGSPGTQPKEKWQARLPENTTNDGSPISHHGSEDSWTLSPHYATTEPQKTTQESDELLLITSPSGRNSSASPKKRLTRLWSLVSSTPNSVRSKTSTSPKHNNNLARQVQTEETGSMEKLPDLIPAPLIIRNGRDSGCISSISKAANTLSGLAKCSTPEKQVISPCEPALSRCEAQDYQDSLRLQTSNPYLYGTDTQSSNIAAHGIAASASTSTLSIVAGLSLSELRDGSDDDPFFTCRESSRTPSSTVKPLPLRPRRPELSQRYLIFPPVPQTPPRIPQRYMLFSPVMQTPLPRPPRTARSLANMLRVPGKENLPVDQVHCPHSKIVASASAFNGSKFHKSWLRGKRVPRLDRRGCWRCDLTHHWKAKLQMHVPRLNFSEHSWFKTNHRGRTPVQPSPAAPPPTTCSTLGDGQSSLLDDERPQSPALEYLRMIAEVNNVKQLPAQDANLHSWRRFSTWAASKFFCQAADDDFDSLLDLYNVPLARPANSRTVID